MESTAHKKHQWQRLPRDKKRLVFAMKVPPLPQQEGRATVEPLGETEQKDDNPKPPKAQEEQRGHASAVTEALRTHNNGHMTPPEAEGTPIESVPPLTEEGGEPQPRQI